MRKGDEPSENGQKTADSGDQPKRDAKGRLKPGHTANRAGKNQFSERNEVQLALSILAADVPPESAKDRREIWKKFIALCKAGDSWAIREYISRRWPVKSAAKDTKAPTVEVRDYTGLAVKDSDRPVKIEVISPQEFRLREIARLIKEYEEEEERERLMSNAVPPDGNINATSRPAEPSSLPAGDASAACAADVPEGAEEA